jgi:hypothetical protein
MAPSRDERWELWVQIGEQFPLVRLLAKAYRRQCTGVYFPLLCRGVRGGKWLWRWECPRGMSQMWPLLGH